MQFFVGDLAPPKYRVLGERPLFRLHNLQPGKDYQVSVYAENAKGKSYPPVILSNVRLDNQLTSLFFNTEGKKFKKIFRNVFTNVFTNVFIC